MTQPTNHCHPTRRDVLRTLAAGAAASLSLPSLLTAAADQPSTAPATPDFSFVVLGDIHYDRLAHHDMDWLRREKPGDVSQVENYSRISRDVTPALFTEVRRRIPQLPNTPFVLQLGDLVEGLCGTPALARKQCEDAAALVQEARLGAPLLMVKGNHDVTGPGADSACDDVLLPAFARHPGAEHQRGANFTLDVGATRFVFFDAYRADESLDWLPSAFEGRPTKDAAGPLFFVIHPPVVPYTGRCWHIFEPAAAARRRETLLRLLAGHNAIVLNGHLHRYGLLTRSVATRHFDQFSVVSVLPDTHPKVLDDLRGTDAYGPSLTNLEPRFSPATLDARKQTLLAEKPAITRFEHANTPGYAIIHVRGPQVTADYYQGTSPVPWRTVPLNPA